MRFNPMQEVPVDDEQAEYALRHERPTILGDSLYGIYRCKRKLGLSVLDAYTAAVETYIDIFEKATQEKEANADDDSDNPEQPPAGWRPGGGNRE